MSEEPLLSMDEGTLRKLLEATLDLAERRQIRSAIRELRQQELERDEEALASKRFRTERQENKENRLRSWQREEEQRQQKSLDALSRKLENIQEVEELTALLRGTSEYEERKLIRAAIRQLRAEEIEAAKLAGKAFHPRRAAETPRASKEQDENAGGDGRGQVPKRAGQELIENQIQEQQLDPKAADGPEPSLGTVLLLEAVPSPPSSESAPFPDGEASGEDPGPNSHEQDSSPEPQLPSEEEDEEEAGGLAPPKAQEGLTSSEGEAMSQTREEEQPERGSVAGGAPPKGESLPSQKREILPRAPEEGGEGAAGQEGGREATVLPGASRLVETDSYKAPWKPPGAEPCQEEPFQRAGSIRERARQFSSDPPSCPPAAPQKASGRLPAPPQPQPRLLPSRHAANSPLRDCGTTTDVRALKAGSKAQEAGSVRPSIPPEAAGPQGRIQGGQWQERKLPPTRSGLENAKGGTPDSEALRGQPSGTAPSPAGSLLRRPAAHPDDEMKTLLTIEIKDSRHQPLRGHLAGGPGNQRAEFTLGLRNSPLRITSASHGASSGSFQKMEAKLPTQPKAAPLTRTEAKEKVPEEQKTNRLSAEELGKIEEEDVLDKMLDQTKDFEERRLIRAAMRDLRQRKRDQREKERNERLQESKAKGGSHTTETTSQQSRTSADGSAISTITKTQRLVQSNDGNKASRTITMEASYTKRSEKDGNTFMQTKSYSSSSSKKVGSIFEREDPSPRSGGSLADLERRQAERKKEIMKAQAMPKMSASQARKAMIEKLEKEGGSPANPALTRVGVQRSSSFGVPNANTIKQMLLDWCRAKTRGYEHVDIQNFSSSWSDGMAFCALVHNFFPEAFDYAQLSPQDRRHNFEMAFSTAETQAECPQLLDVEDMVRMREPDWKCVYTYIQEFYRCLVQKGLVKTKKS